MGSTVFGSNPSDASVPDGDTISTSDASLAPFHQLAAVDLGSNTFRLQVGRVVDDQIYPFDSIKDTVRLASGLTAEKRLDDAVQQRALSALGRFGERLRGFQPESVRVVATSALRQAKNASDFLPRAEEVLGFPIEVIGGREEARLTYIGAHHSLPSSEQTRLVVDIGGGSTEFIIGRKRDPLLMESLRMGCVSFTNTHFPEGRITRRGFRESEMSAAREIERIVGDYRRHGWGTVFGSSGTARAIAGILEANNLNPAGVKGITRHGLEALRDRMIRAGTPDALTLDALPADRLPVLPGGIAIMCAVFTLMGIEQMQPARGALRLGVLYDLLGRFHLHDMRETTVRQFMRRYRVDTRQADRVEKTAMFLLDQLISHSHSAAHEPPEPEQHENDRRFLRWAAKLHEIGLSIAHTGFHKHGAYILEAADMPGFSRQEQSRLARLILGQRGNLLRLGDMPSSSALWHPVACLRLAALLHRSRSTFPIPELQISHRGNAYRLELPRRWLQDNPLSAATLAEESLAWAQTGSHLEIVPRNSHVRNARHDG